MKSMVYKLEEMRDSMEQTIGNLGEVISQQTELKKIIENNESHEKFVEFIDAQNNQINSLKDQVEILKKRKVMLDDILKNCLNPKINEVISNLLVCLGVSEEETEE